MLKVIATTNVKEGCMEQYLAGVKELVEKSQAEEGNVMYTLNRVKDAPNKLIIMEIWKDQAAFEFHIQTPHFITILPQLRAFTEPGEPAMFLTEVEF